MGYLEDVLNKLPTLTKGQPEFEQAVREVLESLRLVVESDSAYRKYAVLERLLVPDRIIVFRVAWFDDHQQIHVNRGYRVQYNNAIGPYKGGLRFHPTVYLGVLKFLAFEQVFKNALTTLPMGGAKGGSDFDPHGRSEREIMRFCQAFMTELFRHIGPDTDVPAGDIGVGAREIGYLYGQYKRLVNEVTGVLTGKGADWGGSYIRPEATGYGLVYFAAEMLATRGDDLANKVCTVSGSGNVAQYTVEQLLKYGAKPVTLSDSSGMIYDADGIDHEKLAFVKELKNVRRGRLREYVERFPKAQYYEKKRPWWVPCDCAFPCATENELDGNDAQELLKNGCSLVAEGANMPSTPEAVDRFLMNRILYAPGKAANAGGVAVSGLEMSQNAQHLQWTSEEVDARLKLIMHAIHTQVRNTAEEFGEPWNYVLGANIVGFRKVAKAMIEQGVW
ncbi:MAG: NADP-specific glutamate dehydrogenase [Candidatus Hydrogenedentota bacterium]|jgi:glutamate dehydrogenase (NADP+)|nr:MAG: NADP-specific glutamate dehydrogenase [Candidatus Hydrogenedentota bacterium]GIX44283.1 MAG: NADP-specific glutamate dehydrogenase [Candidatus Sumerlaea sp.]